MTIEMTKKLVDSFYVAKRVMEQLPKLPDEINSSYMRILDVIGYLTQKSELVRVSDISKELGIPRPGITRSLKTMEEKGLIEKKTSDKDKRVIYVKNTDIGEALHQKYMNQYLDELRGSLKHISDEEVAQWIEITYKVYETMVKKEMSE